MQTYVRRRPRPLGICVRCSTPYGEESLERTAICLQPHPNGGMCGGRVTWRADPDEWAKCPECDATGLIGENRCSRCGGAGWLLQVK